MTMIMENKWAKVITIVSTEEAQKQTYQINESVARN